MTFSRNKLAYILFFLLIQVILIGTSFYFLYSSPSVGITTAWDKTLQRWKVESAEPWSSLKEGDVIQSIGGIEIRYIHLIKSWNYLNYRKEIFEWFDKTGAVYEVMEGGGVPFVISRGPDTIEITLSSKLCRLFFLNSSSVMLLFLGFAFLLIGTVAYCKKENDKRCFLLFLFCAFQSIMQTVLAPSFSSALVMAPLFGFLMTMIAWIVAAPTGTALVYLLLMLPKENSILRRFPKVPWVLCALWFACYGSLQPARAMGVSSSIFILAIFISTRSFFTCENPVERQQMKWVAAGFAFGFGPMLVLNFIPHFLTGRELIDPRYPMSLMVIFPLLISFAIYRYRLIGIDDLLEGTFIYMATLGLLAGIDLCLMGALSSRYGASLELRPTGRLLVSLALTISIYALIRERVRLYLRKLFGREPLNEREILASFTNEASGQGPKSIAKLLESSVRNIFRPKALTLISKANGASVDLLSDFKAQSGPVLLWQSPLGEKIPFDDMLLALPLGRGEDAEYLLLLGELPKGRLYRSREVAILRSLLMQAKLLYENAWLYDENLSYCRTILEEEKKHLREKEKILMDLHDGIGGIMTNIMFLSEIACKSSTGEEMEKPLLTISDLSRDGLSEIRTIMHSLDSINLTWHGLVSDFRSFGARMIEPSGMGFEMETILPDGGKRPGSLLYLNLLRIYKESLTNILKHSGARQVRVRVEIGPEKIALCIEDDGAGLKAEGRKRGGGLSHMETRAKDIGATIGIHSGPGVGTRVEVEVARRAGAVEYSD